MEIFQIILCQERVALKTRMLLKLSEILKFHINLSMSKKQCKILKHMEDQCSLYQIILWPVFILLIEVIPNDHLIYIWNLGLKYI